jgi:myo-inositol-1(or 4)-monophosphatase
MAISPDERTAIAKRAAVAGGDEAMEYFRTPLTVDSKEHESDYLTTADLEAQERIISEIRSHVGDETVVAEEGDEPKSVPETGPAWVVDPIDGTNNFVRGLRFWGASVAAVVDGEPVAAATVLPALGDTYTVDPAGVRLNDHPVTVSDRSNPRNTTVAPVDWWAFDRRDEYATLLGELVRRFDDIRRFFCTQGTLASVASGAIDAAITTVESAPWDCLSGLYMIERAGGRVTDLHGDPWTLGSSGVIASNGACHEALLEIADTRLDRPN